MPLKINIEEKTLTKISSAAIFAFHH